MKNIFRLTCLAIGLCFATLSAQAMDFKPYVGAGAGGFVIDAGLGSETAFGGFAIAGADLHENFGIEFRAGTTGNAGNNIVFPVGSVPGEVGNIILVAPEPATVSVDWFVSYLAKLQYEIAPQFRIYGLVGGTTLRSKIAFQGVSKGVVARATKTTLSYGGGIDYDLGNQWSVGVDGLIYANEASTTVPALFTGIDIWGFSATVKYAF